MDLILNKSPNSSLVNYRFFSFWFLLLLMVSSLLEICFHVIFWNIVSGNNSIKTSEICFFFLLTILFPLAAYAHSLFKSAMSSLIHLAHKPTTNYFVILAVYQYLLKFTSFLCIYIFSFKKFHIQIPFKIVWMHILWHQVCYSHYWFQYTPIHKLKETIFGGEILFYLIYLISVWISFNLSDISSVSFGVLIFF